MNLVPDYLLIFLIAIIVIQIVYCFIKILYICRNDRLISASIYARRPKKVTINRKKKK